MGQIADDMIDGTMCSLCGCYFRDDKDRLYTHGFPVYCWDCHEPGDDIPRADVDTY